MPHFKVNRKHTPDEDGSNFDPLKKTPSKWRPARTSPDEVPGSSTTKVETGYPSSLNFDENDLILAVKHRYKQETPEANEYDLKSKSAEDLYNDIISQAGYKDTNKGHNFRLNKSQNTY